VKDPIRSKRKRPQLSAPARASAREEKCVTDHCPHLETHAEERANLITHALGMLLSGAALSVLVILASRIGDARRIVTVSIYGATLLLMYTASTCYHCVRNSPRLKRAMRIFDHAAIYLLIAGTYTPVVLVQLRGGWGWSLFGVVWGLAGTGVILKLFFVDRFAPLSVTVYLLMGWLALVAIKPIIAALPAGGLGWLFAGGIAYTAGVVFYLWDHLPFNHAIWHLFVLAGSVCHFLLVLLYVLPIHAV
jgi:hemolysin III